MTLMWIHSSTSGEYCYLYYFSTNFPDYACDSKCDGTRKCDGKCDDGIYTCEGGWGYSTRVRVMGFGLRIDMTTGRGSGGNVFTGVR